MYYGYMIKTSKIQKIETLLDRGDSKYLENGVCVKEDGHSTILAVCDSFSKPYDDKNNPIVLFGGLSSGEIVKNIFYRAIEKSHIKDSLLSIVKEADNQIKEFQKRAGFPFRSDSLAGLVFAIAKISQEKIEIIQGGDCIALWKNKNGSIEFTPNIVLAASKFVRKAFSDLLQECNGDRNAARAKFTPILMGERMQGVNQNHKTAYPIMNGQLNIKLCFQKTIDTNNVKTLILFADGLIPFQWLENKTRMKELVKNIEKGGLDYQLQITRKEQLAGKTKKDTARFPESAAVTAYFG